MHNLLSGFRLAAACLAFAAVPAAVSASITSPVENKRAVDELVREYVAPTRIVWQQTDGSIASPEVLLQQGDGQATIASADCCIIENKRESSLLLDFGRELHGGVQIVTRAADNISTRLRLRFGESTGEAMSETVENSSGEHGRSTNDHSQRDLIVSVSRYGSIEIGNTGFRFLRVDMLEPDSKLQLKEIRAVKRFRDLPRAGSFHCSDPRLDSIWSTAVYTVHLNMQEYLWDGIKRDRLIWLGDMHPEVSTILAAFGDRQVVERSLDKAVEQYPLPQWMNGMSAYSLWYLIIHHDWFMHHGDEAFLRKHWNYIQGLVAQIDGRIDAEGNETLASKRFLDWPSSPNEQGVEAGFRALIGWAMHDVETMSRYMDDPATGSIACRARERLEKRRVDPNGLAQAAALMTIAGTMTPREAATKYILPKGADGFTSFYGYYLLQALAANGNYREALDMIRSFWGGMLDLGATTFWEDFNRAWMKNAARIDELTPEGKTDVHGTYGDYCYNGYRHSLCHGWASGPAPWLTRHVLGIEVLEPGCRRLRIDPHLGDLQFAEGSYPTPFGTFRIRVDRAGANISVRITDLPDGIAIEHPDRVSVFGLDPDAPTMGWSSWNTYRVHINDSLILRQAEALVETGLKEAGYRYVNIDDGYFGGRAENGELRIHPQRFPRGLEPVVDGIHSLGLKAGIYSDAGRNTCGNYYDRDSLAQGVGFYGHEQRDADYFFRDLGFDFIKVDFCGGSPHQNTDRLELDEQERYTAISRAIKNTGRDDVRLNICRWDFPGTWAEDVAFSWRISHDIRDRWSSVKDIIRQNLYLSAYCRNGHYNDMDMLEVGRSLTAEEDRTHFGLWCMFASPLLIGCDLTAIRPETLELLRNPELIALDQDPLHLQAYVADRPDSCYLLVKDIEKAYGNVRAFALYNPTDIEKRITMRFSDIGLGGAVALRDLFERTDAGRHSETFVCTLPPHATRIYRAEAEKRLERSRYEAETAYIGAYQELRNNEAMRSGIYEPDARCSGGMKASWLGWSDENCLMWDRVHATKTGRYTLTVAWLSDESASAMLEVNGRVVGCMNCPASDRVCTSSVRIELNEGDNTVRLFNSSARMPDVDYMQIKR